MKGQFNPVLEFNMELELIEVDGDEMRTGVFRHFLSPQISFNLSFRVILLFRYFFSRSLHARLAPGTNDFLSARLILKSRQITQ
jgi:hypothetical protein